MTVDARRGDRIRYEDDAVTAPIAIAPQQARMTPSMPLQRGARPVTPTPPPAPVAAAPAPRRRRKWPWIVAAALLLLIIAVSNSKNGTTTGTTTAAAPVTGSSASAGSAAPTGSPAPAAAPVAPPKVYSGKGDDVITIEKPEGVGILTFSCPKCSGNVIVQSDGAESLLVNTIGSYTGKRWLDASSGSTTTRLTIKATGSWKATVGGVDQATQADGAVSGKGDDVVQLSGNTSTAAVTNKGEGNFIVQSVPADGSIFGGDLAVNEIGSYTGTVPLSTPALVQVTSDGSWTVTPK